MARTLIAVGAAAAVLAVGCSSGSSGGSPQASGTTSPQPTTTVTLTPTAPATVPSASSSPGPVSNLFLAQSVRQSLIAARAAQIGVPTSGFTKLAPGTAYYARDNTSGTLWAGASLIPSKSSMKAQVSSQDDGGYLVFELKPGGTWQVFSTGLTGTPESGPCPVTIPAAVLAVWHWAAGSCRAPNT